MADTLRTGWSMVLLFALTACSGAGGTATSLTAPSPTPSPVPTASPLALTPSSLSFTATGAAAAMTFTVSERGFSGSFSVTTAMAGSQNSCSGIATVAPSSGSGTFTVTPQSNGHCIFTVSDGTQSAPETIDVTTTTVGGS